MQKKVGEDFSNKKFYKFDFSNRKLEYANFRCATLIECNFSSSDLRYSNFTSANCYGSNFTDSILYRANFTDCPLESTIFKPRECFGITVTLKCETFMNMEVDETWMICWMFMPYLMKLPELSKAAKDRNEKSWEDKIIQLVGPETFVKLKAVFNRRII